MQSTMAYDELKQQLCLAAGAEKPYVEGWP